MEVNFFGVVRCVNAFVPSMRARRHGHVVITASIAGRYAYSYDAGPYIASKFAAYGLSENLALYLRPQGIDVTVVCPGLVATNLGERSIAGIDDPSGWTYFPRTCCV
jgi:short-subunit dehydrogenase